MENKLRVIKPNELQVALQSQLVKDSSAHYVATKVKEAIQYAAQFAGQMKAINPDDLTIMTKFVTDEIMVTCKILRVDELKIAFKNGLLGAYGEFYGLNAQTLVKFILAHLKEEKRANEISRLQALQNVNKPEPDKDEKEKIAQQAFDWAFHHFKNTGEVVDYGNGIYYWLERSRKINLTDEQKQVILDQVSTSEYARLKKERKRATEKIDKLAVSKIDNAISEVLEIGESLKVAARNKVLGDYFKSLINKAQ